MKVAYLTDSMAGHGGLERIWTDKMNSLADEYGYDVSLICPSMTDGEANAYELSPNVRQLNLGCVPGIDRQSRFGRVEHIYRSLRLKLAVMKRIKKALAEIRPDVVVTSTYVPYAYIPMKTKRVMESHLANLHYDSWLSLYLRLVERRCDVMVALTNADAATWKHARRVEVIPNFTNVRPEACDITAKRVLAVGRLTHQKGFDYLIKAWRIVARKHAGWSLDIYGDGLLRGMLQRMIDEYSLHDSIRLLHASENIAEVYSEHSVFVLSSRFEGFGLVLLEALSGGLACVAFDCPYGPADMIDDGVNGVLIKFAGVDDDMKVGSLAERICHMIEHEDVRVAMGRAARESVGTFDKHVIMDRWDCLFRSLVEKL